MNEFGEIIDHLKKIGIYPNINTIQGCPTNTEVSINNRPVLLFCSNDYLGLANDPLVRNAVRDAIDKYGMGSGGSRLVSGNTDIQIALEKAITDFKEAECGITFATGYMANTGVIPAIMSVTKFKTNLFNILSSKDSVIFSDELNHASIVDGCRLSRSQICIYEHKNFDDLESKIKKFKNYFKLIVTDGVFSMDGDIAPIPEILRIAREHKATLMIDDAHASGVLGESGRGTLDHFGLPADSADIMMGTFTKAFGGVGGFVVGRQDMIDYLRLSVRSYIFTAPIPPVIAAGLVVSIREVAKGERRQKLLFNAKYIRSKLREAGFNLLDSETQIMPVLIGDEKKCVKFSRQLLERGILLPSITWPAVPRGMSRLRLTVKSDHTTQQLDYFLDRITELGKLHQIIN